MAVETEGVCVRLMRCVSGAFILLRCSIFEQIQQSINAQKSLHPQLWHEISNMCGLRYTAES